MSILPVQGFEAGVLYALGYLVE